MKRFFKWLDNFWYHHKWKTIIISAFVLIIVVCIVTAGKRGDPDVRFLYTGSAVLKDTDFDRMEEAFAALVDADYNGDGKKNTEIVNLTILSDEQIEEAKEKAKEEGGALYYDPSLRPEALKQMRSLMATGSVSVCLMEPYTYHQCEEGTFVKLSEILGDTPENAYDEYAMRFSDLPFRNAFYAFDALPDDLLVCLRKKAVLSGNQKEYEKQYENSVSYFRALCEYGKEN